MILATLDPETTSVQLSHMSIEPCGPWVKIAWSTANERDNKYFAIERSEDQNDYQTVAIVEGAGNSTTETDYFELDTNPLMGRSYYRLKQVGFDGAFCYFLPTAVDQVPA